MAIAVETLAERHRECLEAIDLARIDDDLQRLAGAEFAGRRVGSAGHDQARDWLAARLTALGFEVTLPGDTASVDVLDLTAEPTLAIRGDPLRYRRDFAEHARSSSLADELTAPVVRAEGAVAGSWAALTEVPVGDDFAALVADLREREAVGLLTPQERGADGYLTKRIAGTDAGLPCIAVEAQLLERAPGGEATARLPLRRVRPQLANVVGSVPAEGGRRPLLIGAHYDGIGDDVGRERFSGASDNASGVAVVLEVARVLSAVALRRPLYVVAFDGEEVNAQGSASLALDLPQSLVLNLDGAARLHETVAVEPSPNSEELVAALDAAGRACEIPLSVAPVASDNRRFAAAGHPAVGVGLGFAAMHSPADTPDRVDASALLAGARLLLATALHLAAQ